MSQTPAPFRLQVDQGALDDLHQRLARTRFPEQPPGEAWTTGTDPAYMRDLVTYWRDGFSWPDQVARLNEFPQFTLALSGIQLHYLHVPGKGPNPCPLLLSHGWPGSVFEFLDIIPRLTDPARFGGDPADAFTVIAPSLPGYGLSFQPGQPRFSVEAMADCFAALMSDVLGYKRFAAQGGDWGSTITARLAFAYPERLIGIHLNMMPLPRDLAKADMATEEGRAYHANLWDWLREGTGYSAIQGTKPQTLAFGLSDSPVGLAAWIVEKFRSWSDCDGDVEVAFSRDHMLANISFYWFTGAIGSSFWPYYARMHDGWQIAEGATTAVPAAYAAFPAEMVRPPRSLAQQTFTDLRRWSVMPKGGHFAAMEQPEALAADVAAFFRPLRASL
ncbi:epoxide hydrolase family protein [Acidisphaera sp. L21]|uniref:epoxide hydrolase family protein n=1 Tax=Acidisphaera sp. L21 TaxID=1641851 RepID=UPI00131D6C48|nr:epoxide hydrolase family protein [Acidisphaera sp. L21]